MMGLWNFFITPLQFSVFSTSLWQICIITHNKQIAFQRDMFMDCIYANIHIHIHIMLSPLWVEVWIVKIVSYNRIYQNESSDLTVASFV